MAALCGNLQVSAKDELVSEALERSLEKSFEAMEPSADEGAIAEVINEYPSRVHRDDFDNACPLPALGTELWRAGGETRPFLARACN